MTLDSAEGTWTPEFYLTTGLTETSGDLVVTSHSPGDNYGNWTRLGSRVWIDFCQEFTLDYSTGVGVLRIRGLPFSVGIDPDASTCGTGLGEFFAGVNNSAILPSLPDGMTNMNTLATPTFNALHFQGYKTNPSISPMLLATSNFTSGYRRYIRGTCMYLTDDEFPT